MRKGTVKAGTHVTTLRKGIIHGGNYVEDIDFAPGHFDQLVAKGKIKVIEEEEAPVVTPTEEAPEVPAEVKEAPAAEEAPPVEEVVAPATAEEAKEEAPVPQVGRGRRKKK